MTEPSKDPRGDEVVIRPARGDEADHISALALRSKGYWGYSQEFLDACRDELTYTAEVCGSGDVVVAESCGEVVGFFVLHGTGPVGELDALFVDPSAIGSGLGRRLLTTALEQARDRDTTPSSSRPIPARRASTPITVLVVRARGRAARYRVGRCR